MSAPHTNKNRSPDRRLRLLLDLLKPHKGTIFKGLAVLLFVDLIQVFLPLVVKEVVDHLERGTFPFVFRGYEVGVGEVMGIFLLAGLLVMLSRYAWRILIFGASRLVERDLRAKLYKRLARVPLGFYDGVQVGDLMGRASNDIEAVRNMSGILVVAAFDGVVWGVLTLSLMFSLDWRLALAVLIPFPAIAVFTKVIGAAFHKKFKVVQEAFSQLSAAVEEMAGGILALKGFGAEKGESLRLVSKAGVVRDAGFELARLEAWFEPVFRTAAGLGIAILLAYGGGRVASGDLTLGGLAAFLQYFAYLVWPFLALGFMVNLYQRGTASLMRIQELIDEEPEPRPTGLLPKGSSIKIENLSFAYRENDWVLEDMNLEIQSGQRVGVVGPTGCGKTTLFRLLLGLYPSPDGTLLVGGVPRERVEIMAWRRMTAWCPQDAITFSDTVRNNLTLGAKIPEDQLWEALEVAALAGDVRSMPKGMDNKVGERGISLSGGQRQRLALARAVAQSRDVLLLDDALTAVDAETEDKIHQNLEGVMEGRTVVVATHRLSSIRGFDQILILDMSGRQIAFGPPDDLMEKNASFRRMWRLSTGESL